MLSFLLINCFTLFNTPPPSIKKATTQLLILRTIVPVKNDPCFKTDCLTASNGQQLENSVLVTVIIIMMMMMTPSLPSSQQQQQQQTTTAYY